MTAENVDGRQAAPLRPAASMRPRPMTAENEQRRGLRRRVVGASMRPRPMTAENRSRIDAQPDILELQ